MNSFDKNLKAKLSELNEPFDAAAWNDAAALLDKHYAASPWRALLWWALPLMVMGTGLVATAPQMGRKTQAEFIVTEASGTMPSATNNKNRASQEGITQPAVAEVVQAASLSMPLPAVLKNNPTATSEPTSISTEPLFEADIATVQAANFFVKMPVNGMPRLKYGGKNTVAGRGTAAALISALRRFQLLAYAQGGVARGFQNDLNRRLAPTATFALGAELALNINQHVYLSSGFGLFSRGSLANTDLYAISGETVETKALQAISAIVPLNAFYRFGARQALGFGFQLNPLLMTITRTTATEGGAATYGDDRTGFTPIDAAFNLHHRVFIGEKTQVFTTAHIGLFDATENNATNTSFDRNLSLRVGLARGF